MKKIVLSLATVVALSLAVVSCGKAESADSASNIKAKIENCTNPDSVKVYVEQAKAYAEKLVKEGKVDEAKKYLAEIEPVVNEKAPALSGVLTTVSTALDKVKDAAGDATDAAAATADSVKNAAADAATGAVESVKDKAEDVTNKAGEAVGNAADKAKDAVSKAAEDGADKVKDLLK